MRVFIRVKVLACGSNETGVACFTVPYTLAFLVFWLRLFAGEEARATRSNAATVYAKKIDHPNYLMGGPDICGLCHKTNGTVRVSRH